MIKKKQIALVGQKKKVSNVAERRPNISVLKYVYISNNDRTLAKISIHLAQLSEGECCFIVVWPGAKRCVVLIMAH